MLIGKLALLPQASEIAGRVEDLTGIRFTIAETPDYATAIGAALCAGEESGDAPPDIPSPDEAARE